MGQTEEFEPAHDDRVTALHVNYDGSRILTASIDHRVKVWNVDRKTGERTLIDTFTAHDADIRDAKFAHPTVGSYIGTVAADLKFSLWEEDVSQAYNSGRRFRLITSIPSTPRVPFASLDFKTIDNIYTYLALIDRQGLLSIYEPSSPDDLREWTLLDQFHVCSPVPNRGDETSFKVRWDQNETPLSYINSVSDDENQLALIVSSINEVKIYHSAPDTETQPTNPSFDSSTGGATHRMTFHEAFRLPTHPALIRDVSWSPFNVRGVERIATACKDGAIRVFEIGIIPTQPSDQNTDSAGTQSSNNRNVRSRPSQQSSLTSAITGKPNSNAIASTGKQPKQYAFPFAYQILHVSTLPAHEDAWSVSWDGQGQVLMSGGSDGVTKLWRKSVQGGQWLLFADQAAEFGEKENGE